MSGRSKGGREAEARRGDGERERPSSRAEQSASRAGGGGGPPRAPTNSLFAEVAKLAKQRLEAEKAAKGDAAGGGPERPPSRGGWRAAVEEQEEQERGAPAAAVPAVPAAAAPTDEPEPGELPADGPGSRSPAGAAEAGTEAAAAVEDRDVQQRSRKRKHEPIVWSTPPKPGQPAAAGGSAAEVGGDAAAKPQPPPRSSSAAGALAGLPGASLSAADIAHAELLVFQQRQEEEDGEERLGEEELKEQGFMKASPSVSSPEEEMHILREGTTAQDADAALAAESRKRSRWADAADSSGAVQEEQQQQAAGSIAEGLAGKRPAGAEGQDGVAAQAGERDGGATEQEGSEATGAGGGGEEEGEEAEEQPALRRPATMLADCRSVDHYEKLNRISEGTYGVVYRARDRGTGAICALKKVKLDKEREGFPLTSVREINILLSLDHPNIVNVSEVVVGSSLDSVFMVMEYGDHDLRGVMEGRMTQPFSTAEVKTLMAQLLSGVAYLHERWVLHRDLKTSNILYTNRGQLKICDFGLARQYGSPLKPYTHCVVTLWYRAPELLLGQKVYSTAVDVWSCGCIMGELLAKEPLIQGKNELDQLQKTFGLVGTPTEEAWPDVTKLSGWRKFNFRSHPRMAGLRQRFPPPGLVFDGRPALSEAGFDLLQRLLEPCPERRISAQDALEHPWFREHPMPKDPALMPTFPSTSERPRA